MYAKKGGLGLVKSRRFAPLFATQFLGAFNDNVFKTALFVMIGFYGLGQNGFLPAGQMLNLGALLFILPYFLFSSLSGQLGNKFDKAVLARWVKVLEMIIMAVGGIRVLYPVCPAAFGVSVLHGRAIDAVRAAEIRHPARLSRRQRVDDGQQPD
uniref:Uncharacterized protein n=1 Tax=Neisseria meningitidis alpha153 TaxID=663926 RepID=C6SD88_NEIME|nr:hypothetical protein NME_1256 [Neisseria meningitidis alpha153]